MGCPEVETSLRASKKGMRHGSWYWARQFGEPRTPSQLTFDIAFGIVIPILCLVFDPIVFKSGWGLGGFLSPYRFIAYCFVGFEIATLVAWLAVGSRTGPYAALISGALFSGAAGSLAIGVVMIPISLIGAMAMGIGLLGFMPFLTAIAFLRNGVRAARFAKQHQPGRQAALAAVLGAVVTVAIVTRAEGIESGLIEKALIEATSDDPATADRAMKTLELVNPIGVVNCDPLVYLYDKETNPRRKEKLAGVYRRLTGHDIEDQLYYMYK
jgi:hypothetical protein